LPGSERNQFGLIRTKLDKFAWHNGIELDFDGIMPEFIVKVKHNAAEI
jgi:hypothetical protein